MHIRRLAPALLAVATLAAGAPAALAGGPPAREPVGEFHDTLRGVCSFPLRLDDVVNTQTLKRFPDGRRLVTGRELVRATNLATGASIVLNASGAGTFTTAADGTITGTTRGHWLWFFFEGELGPGEPGEAFVTAGLTVVTISPEGRFTIVRRTGRSLDICAALA